VSQPVSQPVSKPVQPRRSAEPSPAAESTAADENPDESAAEENEVPLNRAARRAKAGKAEPSHVGPRDEQGGKVRGARPHQAQPLNRPN
jgi:hypothetical protein